MAGYIHPLAQRELDTPARTGDRHAQILRIVPFLAGDGWSAEEMFSLLRPLYADDVSDREIRDVTKWATSQSFAPSYRPDNDYEEDAFNTDRPPPLTEEEKIARWTLNTEIYLDGFRASLVDLWEASPIRYEWAGPNHRAWPDRDRSRMARIFSP